MNLYVEALSGRECQLPPEATKNERLEAALAYAADGRFVLPCSANTKRPRTAHGLLDASRDEDVIRRWWANDPDAAVAIRTGSVSGRVVLDVDGPDGEESLYELTRELGALPETAEALTPHGRHLHFSYPAETSFVRCAVAFRGLAGLDIRGDGGYALVPPSPGYAWELSSSAIAPLPIGLVATARCVVDATTQPIRRGTRNTALASLAGTMRRRGMSEAAIKAGLIADNRERCTPPLDDEEVLAIAKSVSRYEPADRHEIRRNRQSR